MCRDGEAGCGREPTSLSQCGESQMFESANEALRRFT